VLHVSVERGDRVELCGGRDAERVGDHERAGHRLGLDRDGPAQIGAFHRSAM